MTDTASYKKLAARYFNFLAQRFPVMCASDEFHFLPRADDAGKYYDYLENINTHSIGESIRILKDFYKEFSISAGQEHDLEKRIDLELLKSNISGVLIELEQKQSWRHNPLLYLKIAFIGLDHAINKPASESREQIERTLTRLSKIPGLLKQAMDNIVTVPQTYHRAALYMLADCKQYLIETKKKIANWNVGNHSKEFQSILSSLVALKKFLNTISPVPDQRLESSSLGASLKDHFLSARSLDEIFQIAVNEWQQDVENLGKLQSKIDSKSSWQDLYHAYSPSEVKEKDLISLYENEIEQLKSFFGQRGFSEEDLKSPLEVTETPVYLRSVRGTASFAAASGPDAKEKSLFYITTRLMHPSNNQSDVLLQKRLHREYKFLSAHETIPGHHCLDSIRRSLRNPIRRQIESPLFYEGWASYTESLLAEYGYVNTPLELLTDYKRRLWRSARCQIDVGLATGQLAIQGAMELLKTCGFSSEETQRQIYRFRLNPGYQLCYSLGCYEIKQLRAAYATKMNSAKFHQALLEGGELPFHLIKQRLEAHHSGI